MPAVVVTDYTPEQAANFRAQFKPLAENYRHRSRKMGWCMAGCFVFAALGFILPVLGLDFTRHLFPFFFFGGIFGFIFFALRLPTAPNCPACLNQLDGLIGTFCPECGSSPLLPGQWLDPPRCNSCRKRLGNNKGRQYKIRACTHCGVMLDEKGI